MSDFDVHKLHLQEISRTLLKIQEDIFHIKNQNHKILMTIDELKSKVDAEATVEQSAITLLQGLSAQLTAAKNDPAKIQAIADEIDANSASLSSAITANTPAA